MEKTYLPLVNIEEVLSILNKIAIFGGLSDKQLYVIFKILKKTFYRRGEIIFRKGDYPSHIYIVKKGKVKLYLEAEGVKFELIEFSTGDCFGETALIGIQPHTANSLATEDVELMVLEGKDLFSLYYTHRDVFAMVILNIAREVSRRLSLTDNTILHYVKGVK